jgi:hypothetical protein
MATLKTKRRNKLPKTAFAIPSQRLYPIDTKARARAALAYSARPTTRGSYTTVRKAVVKRYPDLAKASQKRKGPTTTTSAKRGTSRKTATLAPSTQGRRR